MMCKSCRCEDHDDPLDWESRRDSVPFWRHAVAGSMAGVMEHLGMYPLDTIKTRMQTATLSPSGGVIQTMRMIIAERGVLGLFRGASVIGTGCIPAHIGLFTTYEFSKSHLLRDDNGADHLLTAACGATASTVHDVILTPHDVVKQRLQLGCYNGPWNCLREILRQEGVIALYRSLPVTMVSNAPHVAILATVNESMKTFLNLDRGTSADLPWFFFCGGVAGAVAAAATCPLDVVKTQIQTCGALQAMHRPCAPRSPGIVQMVRNIWRTHGLGGFYSGMTPRMIASVPSAAMCWGTYELVQSMFRTAFDDDAFMENSTGRARAASQVMNAVERAASAADAAVTSVGVGTDSDEDPLEWEHWDPTKVPLWKHMVAGSAAGVMEHVAMYPADTVKTQMQAVTAVSGAAPMTVRATISSMWQEQGVMAFFRGCTAIGVACIPAHIGLFGTYELTKSWLLKPGSEKEHSPLRAAACGALSTMVHDSIIVPMDVVKQRLQLGCYQSTWDCVLRTYQSEGIIAFYRSLPSTMLMECPFYAILVASNESLKLALKMEGASRSADRSGLGWHFVSAGVSGVIASAATQPLDVVKTRLQTQEILRDMARGGKITSDARYRGLTSTFSAILREEGVPGLYRGTVPRMIFAAPSAAMCWGTYEAIKVVLSRF
eukprot:TRINITY_DN2202_c0_g1_i1.p1 TRINITY_DN2202_c0_g1~~TRINITY_DN2202_c0_g1_i1.p1  ORF type:complete len:661 (-),score=71.56 TRINITY_DN2202_c0_g1_i1:368-2350(-)